MHNVDQAAAITVFLLAYILIITEKFHRAIVALAGALILIIVGTLKQVEAINSIDFNTLGVLIGMMIIVGITRRSGIFEYMAVKAAKVGKGDPVRILVILTIVTTILSSILDNVTTVLLIVPVTFAIADRLKVNPIPFLLCQVIGSNIGGTATLIGDPPNIMIGSATGLGFMDFFSNLAPVVILILLVTLPIMAFIYRNSLRVGNEVKQRIMDMAELEAIKDMVLVKKSLLAIGITVVGFCMHQNLHLASATVAMAGAVFLMLITDTEPEEILLAVEWPTIFFFIGLFVLVHGLVQVGTIDRLAQEVLLFTKGDYRLTALCVLWFSGLSSAIVDNVPMVAAMIPLLETIGRSTGMPMEPLWWSLALGACLGGNGTIIGASANVVVAGMSEKHGVPITFKTFLLLGFPLMILSLAISTLYVLARYLP